MISEERLEELIEQTKPVYAVVKTKQWRNLGRERYMVMDLRFGLSNTPPLVIRNDANFEDQVINYEDLYETKEQAEWARDFQRIERTEYLNLPSWKEFIKKYTYEDDRFEVEDSFCFIGHDGIRYYLCSPVKSEIYVQDIYGYKDYAFEFSEKGYTQACEMAKRLFLGEEEK